MQISAGTIIKSTTSLNGSVFENVFIIITKQDTDGTIGFIINKPFDKQLNALQEFSHLRYFNLYNGGPVDKEHLFFIHCQPDVIEDSTKICDGIFYGGNFTQAVAAINNYALTEKDIKIFIGYCGWDAGELDAEVEEGSWEVIDLNNNSVFAK